MRPALLPALAATAIAIALCACGGGSDAGGTPAKAAAGAPDGLSARELMDATDAIEKFLNAERTREAVLVARKLVERAPAGSAAAATANELLARACFTRAQLAGSDADAAERKSLREEAADCAARAIGAGQPDAARVAFAALLASSAGRAAQARALYDRAIELAPTDASTLLQAALAALGDTGTDIDAAGRVARARALASRRVAAAPGDPWNDGLAAEIAMAESRPAEAVDAAQRAVAADRDRLEFRMLLARALRKAGRAADAARLLSALEPAERAKPALAEQFALALAESGDLAAAARAWDTCLRANQNDAFVRAEAALAFRRAGDDARAAAELAALKLMKGGAEQLARIAPLLSSPPANGGR